MSTSIDSVSSLGSYMSLLLMNAQSMQKRQDDLFSKIDSDSSSGIDKVEFSAFAKKLSADSGNSINVDDVFSQYDVNGDGSLSSDELNAYMKDNAPPPPPMNAQSMEQGQDDLFSKIDSDSSSGIDKTEFSTFANKMSADSGKSQNVDDVFSQYDVNGDGSLSSDELKAFMKNNAPPPPPPQMQNARSAYGTDQETDQTTTLQELLNKLSATEGTESATTTDSFKALISKLIESLLNGGSSSLVNVTA